MRVRGIRIFVAKPASETLPRSFGRWRKGPGIAAARFELSSRPLLQGMTDRRAARVESDSARSYSADPKNRPETHIEVAIYSSFVTMGHMWGSGRCFGDP
jgi:hypothetical protein